MLNPVKFKHTIRYCLLALPLLLITSCGQGLSEQQMLDKAKTHLHDGDLKSGAIELRNTLQKNSENAQARYLLGSISYRFGDMDAAEKEFRRAALAGWDQQQTQLALARTFIAKNELQKLLDEIIVQETWSANNRANISALRALAEASLNQTELAKTTLEKARNYQENALQVLKTTAIFQLADLLDGDATQTLKLALSQHTDNTELLLLLASYNLQNNKLTAAEAGFKKTIQLEPAGLITVTTLKANIGLARVQILNNELDQAKALLASVLKSNKNNPEANYLSGFIHFSQQDFSRAEEYIRNLLSILPNHVQSHQLMGKIKYALNEHQQAAHHLSLYLNAAPGDAATRMMLTQTYIRLNQAKLALSTLQPVLKVKPDDAAVQSLFSQIAFIKGDTGQGIESLKKAIKSRPDNIVLHKQLINAYISADKTEQALAQINIFRELSNNTVDAQKMTISAYLAANKPGLAMKVTDEMLLADPNSADIMALKGGIHATKNELQPAKNFFEQARQQQQNHPVASIGLARLENKAGNFDKAIELYKQLIDSNQAGILPMLALSELAAQQQRTDDMLSWLEKARTTAPSDLRPRIILGNYYLRNTQPAKASIYSQEALEIAPDHNESLNLHGRVLIAQQRFNEALLPLENLLQKQPDSIGTQLLLAEAFSRLGETTKAREHLQAVLKKQQDNLLATLLMAEIEFNAKNYDSSLHYAKRLQQLQTDLFTGYMMEGNVWLARQDYHKAHSAYTKAWQRQKTAELAIKLSFASKHTGTFDTAIKPLLSWLDQHPEDAKTRMHLADMYLSENRNSNAIQEYEIILQKETDNIPALNNLAWLYSLQGKLEALDLAARAYRLTQTDPYILDTYGWILVQQGEVGKGLRLLEQAKQLLPDSLDVRYHHAVALIKSGKTDEGRNILEKLIQQGKPFMGRDEAIQLLGK